MLIGKKDVETTVFGPLFGNFCVLPPPSNRLSRSATLLSKRKYAGTRSSQQGKNIPRKTRTALSHQNSARNYCQTRETGAFNPSSFFLRTLSLSVLYYCPSFWEDMHVLPILLLLLLFPPPSLISRPLLFLPSPPLPPPTPPITFANTKSKKNLFSSLLPPSPPVPLCQLSKCMARLLYLTLFGRGGEDHKNLSSSRETVQKI